VRPIQTIFDALGILPGYEEIDISAAFLTFLSIFFAMIVGDAGYGVIFLALTLWARKKMPAAPARIFQFLKLMSVCTIAWGVVTGTYFSIPVIPWPLQRLKIPWLGNERNVMLLSFILGSVHLTVAHLWNLIRGINSLKALAQLGWIGMTWTMFFIACTMVLGLDFTAYVPCVPVPVLNVMFPKFMAPVFFASLAAIVLFMTPLRDVKTEWYNHALLPLTLVSNFIDVVSYIRLYAVGVAGVAIASSFNQMATAGVNSVVSGLIAALILFLGHALNLTLSALGVLVHGVRLNVLEFTNHIGMQWTGFPYQPFARKSVRAAEKV
jgi:V/A-type H+-transporting ATPase subunit I